MVERGTGGGMEAGHEDFERLIGRRDEGQFWQRDCAREGRGERGGEGVEQGGGELRRSRDGACACAREENVVLRRSEIQQPMVSVHLSDRIRRAVGYSHAPPSALHYRAGHKALTKQFVEETHLLCPIFMRSLLAIGEHERLARVEAPPDAVQSARLGSDSEQRRQTQ